MLHFQGLPLPTLLGISMPRTLLHQGNVEVITMANKSQ